MVRGIVAFLVNVIITPAVLYILGHATGGPIVGALSAIASIAVIVWVGIDIAKLVGAF